MGNVLSCTMIVTTPTWGAELTRDWAWTGLAFAEKRRSFGSRSDRHSRTAF
jgi:hypothetical protein